MTDTPEKFVERCRAYAEKASEGPWYQDCQPGGPCAAKCYADCVFRQTERGRIITAERPKYECAKPPQVFSDMVFIAAARTDLPAALSIIATLVRERDEARAEIERLRNALSISIEAEKIRLGRA